MLKKLILFLTSISYLLNATINVCKEKKLILKEISWVFFSKIVMTL